MELSHTEENYLKAIYKITEQQPGSASTTAISALLDTSAASVTDMVQRLASKSLVNYERYKGVTLTSEGIKRATYLVRKHRLWEVFLSEKLGFNWDEVHDIAEQLEHIRSPQLVERLDEFLAHPKYDPHGDPIPDASGNIQHRKQIRLGDTKPGQKAIIVGVDDHSPAFLQYLDRLSIQLGAHLEVLEVIAYDDSLRIRINEEKEAMLSRKVVQHLYVQTQST